MLPFEYFSSCKFVFYADIFLYKLLLQKDIRTNYYISKINLVFSKLLVVGRDDKQTCKSRLNLFYKILHKRSEHTLECIFKILYLSTLKVRMRQSRPVNTALFEFNSEYIGFILIWALLILLDFMFVIRLLYIYGPVLLYHETHF